MEPLNIMGDWYQVEETDSEASRCRDINFYRKKHRCFKLTATLTYLCQLAFHCQCFCQVINTRPLSCDGLETWQHGNSLVNYMKLVEMKGLTGQVKFDQRGLRTDFKLEIIELKKHGLVKVGSWHDVHGIKMERNYTETLAEIEESLQNKTLVVTTVRVSNTLDKAHSSL